MGEMQSTKKNKEKFDTEHLIIYDLQFFAKEGSGGEKTEDATPKKLQDARKEGQVAKSIELITALSLIGFFLILKFFSGFIGTELFEIFSEYYAKIPVVVSEPFGVVQADSVGKNILFDLLRICLPIFLGGFLIAFLGNIFQVKWLLTTKPLKPKLSKINPISGFKKIISKDKIIEFLKSVAKIIVIIYVVYDAVKGKWKMLLSLYDINLAQAVILIGNTVIDLGLKISILFLIIGFADLIYQRIKFKNDMKMTKQEVKDEYKNSEGDPQIKGRIRSKMREASRRRMMQELPKADVIITNPTHFAVAIQYNKEIADAPIVMAKGADYLAQKIKEIAKENFVEIVENKPLARMLYYNVEVGQEIPPELYQTVAEILAYVYSIKNKTVS